MCAEPDSQLINQRFLPRITEGEIRVLMIFDRPVQIVHKKPGRKGFSATLFSGARHDSRPASTSMLSASSVLGHARRITRAVRKVAMMFVQVHAQ